MFNLFRSRNNTVNGVTTIDLTDNETSVANTGSCRRGRNNLTEVVSASDESFTRYIVSDSQADTAGCGCRNGCGGNNGCGCSRCSNETCMGDDIRVVGTSNILLDDDLFDTNTATCFAGGDTINEISMFTANDFDIQSGENLPCDRVRGCLETCDGNSILLPVGSYLISYSFQCECAGSDYITVTPRLDGTEFTEAARQCVKGSGALQSDVYNTCGVDIYDRTRLSINAVSENGDELINCAFTVTVSSLRSV